MPHAFDRVLAPLQKFGRDHLAANFFEQYTNADTYNSDRGEVLRGANSILFGLGNPAGIINQSTKVANLQKNILQVSTKTDNFGSTRTVLDVSRVLAKDRFAARLIAYQRPLYQVLALDEPAPPRTGQAMTLGQILQQAMERKP